MVHQTLPRAKQSSCGMPGHRGLLAPVGTPRDSEEWMPARTPRMDQRTPPEEGSSYPSDVFASNLRAYRRLRDLEQEMVANRLANFGHTWTRQTVSDVERGRRKDR